MFSPDPCNVLPSFSKFHLLATTVIILDSLEIYRSLRSEASRIFTDWTFNNRLEISSSHKTPQSKLTSKTTSNYRWLRLLPIGRIFKTPFDADSAMIMEYQF